MSVLAILDDDFLAEMPEDNHVAFGMVLRRADAYLTDALTKVDESEQSSWYGYETAQHTAMNTIIAVARRFEIEPFASMAVPRRKGFSSEKFAEFKVDLDHYTAQLLSDNSIRTKRDAISIEPKAKDRLRQHIHGIKTLIDQAEMPEPRRAALHKKIADFEAALDKPRVNIVMLCGVMVAILSGAANVAVLADSPVMSRLVSNIMSTIGQAKAVEDEKRELAPVEPPRIALPPRPPETPAPRQDPGKSRGEDLDDDMPF